MKSKSLVFTLLILLYCSCLSAKELVIDNTSGKNLNFDSKYQYLNISLADLSAPIPESPGWWDKLLGKQTNYGLAYVEISGVIKSHKIPLFTYSRISKNNYDFNSVAVKDQKVLYPLLRWAVYNNDNPPTIKIVVKSWEDKKNAETVKKIIDAAALFGGIEATAIEKTLSMGDIAVELINRIWPDKNETNTISLSLVKDNLNKQFITLKFIDNDQNSEEVMKLKISLSDGHFVGKTFQSSIDDFSTSELLVWREAILSADSNLEKTGKTTLLAQLNKFSNYISSLNLTWVDKVLLLGGAIDTWAHNAVSGANYNEEFIQFNMADYRRLSSSDWPILNKYSRYYFVGDNKCHTDACRNMATFLARASIGDKDGFAKNIGHRVLIVVNGKTTAITKSDFVDQFILYGDSGFKIKKYAIATWLFNFEAGALDFKLGDNEYIGKKVIISLVQLDSSFFVSKIKVQ
ncbi:MAG: hypothetical protein K8R86_10595 [Bacteroidales bacterium]|nr:hypothetical protein [Bacteroidales bacterium]